ncbi:ArnT family glycosyltransferase [Providencia stuartii]|uniref:ArnT family glycosyltransferase n=1 Tax=Providencia stuartii TaxID=588 RepID=UPI0004F7F071|nr:glycosyltransferase family 39 protein [Providencia stuartii]AIN65852.1 dolichyl-phosphate-mannose-mannosyltransferase family protein [Providencia stuartii]MBK1419184.1 glycosyltransferase family 39 protein [Providencia stuartii]QQC53248.1 glycosyltransferase family 39 protein [Providencia stuartii]
MPAINQSTSNKYVYLWVIGYAVAWILASFHLDPTVPYDTVEAVNWGMNGEWGSPKNPWFVGVLMWPAIYLGISYSFYWYFIHFVGVAFGLLGVWKLAYRLTARRDLAWFAMLMLNLSGVINFDIIPYNDNYILVTFWAWIIYFFLRAVYENPAWWLLFALFAGLATMGKYSTLSLVGSVFLLTLFVKQVRQSYRYPVFYLAIALWFAIVLPNFFWLMASDFSAFKWVDSQIDPGFNLHTTKAALSVFYPLIIAAIILYSRGGKLGWPKSLANRMANFLVLFPLAVIYGWFSFHDGGRITEWLQPFMAACAPLFIGSITVMPTKSLRKPLIGLALFGVVVLLGYCVVQAANIKGAGQKFIGVKTLIAEGEDRWHERYGVPLKYVGGEDNLHQWFIIYAKDRPHVIQPWTLEHHMPPNVYNRKITEAEIRQHGALLLGRKYDDCTHENFDKVRQYWPQFTIEKEEVIYRSEPDAEPETMCFGFIAPEKL